MGVEYKACSWNGAHPVVAQLVQDGLGGLLRADGAVDAQGVVPGVSPGGPGDVLVISPPGGVGVADAGGGCNG